MWAYLYTPQENSAGTSSVHSPQKWGGKRCVCVCLWARDRWMPTAAGWIQPPKQSICWPLHTCSATSSPPSCQALSPISRHCPATTVVYKAPLWKVFFFLQIKTLPGTCSQDSTCSATDSLSGWENYLTTQRLLSSSLCSLHCMSGVLMVAVPNQTAHGSDGWQEPPVHFYINGKSVSLSGGFIDEPLYSQLPNVSFQAFYLCKPNR